MIGRGARGAALDDGAREFTKGGLVKGFSNLCVIIIIIIIIIILLLLLLLLLNPPLPNPPL